MKKRLNPLMTAFFSICLILCGGCQSIGRQQTLFNGNDLSGWEFHSKNAEAKLADTWSVAEGKILCSGKPAGYLRTLKDFENYHLHVEWRWPGKGGNSGVLVHQSGPDKVWPRSIECQLAANNAGDFWVIETEFKEHREQSDRVKGRRVIKLAESNEKPLGEWNEYDIYCRGSRIQVFVNGLLQNEATDSDVTNGKICLQSEGRPIEFRNIYVEPQKTGRSSAMRAGY